jgi:CRP-like cAMP-binding protein
MTSSATPVATAELAVDSILDRLSKRAAERLARVGRPVDYARDAVIIHEGEDTPFLGLIEHGRVSLRMRVPELGRRVTILTVEPGELIGWSAVVPPYRATVDAVATETTRLRAFDATELRALLSTYPALAIELPPLILETVSRRLTASWTQLLDLFGAKEPAPW